MDRIRTRRPRPRDRHPRHPLFDVLREQGRSQVWLARKTGYSAGHVWNVAAGIFPASAAFRARCAAELGLDEATLFHPADTSCAPAPPKEDAAINRAGTAAAPVYGAANVPSRRSA